MWLCCGEERHDIVLGMRKVLYSVVVGKRCGIVLGWGNNMRLCYDGE